MTPATDRSGILLALAGYALLSVGDAVVKSMADEWAPTAIAALRYTLGAMGLSAILLAREGRSALAIPRPALQLARGLCVGIATAAFFTALAFMPLAEATTIVFVAPIVTALLAPLLIGEVVRRGTLVASVVAFAGVIVVLRPNVLELGWPALLPLASAFGMGLLVIANRAVAREGSALAMQAYIAVTGAVLVVFALLADASGMATFTIEKPSASVVARCVVVAITASSAHWLVYLGTTRAGASAIAPMTYVQLLTATALGWVFFGNRPDLATWAGAAIIIGAGLYLWWSGKASRKS